VARSVRRRAGELLALPVERQGIDEFAGGDMAKDPVVAGMESNGAVFDGLGSTGKRNMSNTCTLAGMMSVVR
jgi:hypothetical protein